jgi:phage shock protein A
MEQNKAPQVPSAGTASPIAIAGSAVTIQNLVVDDPLVADYLLALPAAHRADHVGRAVALGIHGMATTSMRATLDDVKDEVRRILDSATAAAEQHLNKAVDSGRTQLAAHLDPDVRTSLTARTFAELEELHASMLARLDPDRSDSYTNRLVAAITDLLGPGGQLAQRLEAAFDSTDTDSSLGRVVETFERRFQELRDLVVGEQNRTKEAARGTAKGLEFEDQVEAVLRSQARAIGGCIVERTGLTAGKLGLNSKVGDFVVTLADGTRVVVEAKNVGRMSLTGTTGILSELDQAMDNRNASWAICVSRGDSFPSEVGHFAVYGNRVLVVDAGEGTLTGVGIRWINSSAVAATQGADAVDTVTAQERLNRIRDLAQHFSRSKRALGAAQDGLESVRHDLDSLRSQLIDLVDDIARALRPPTADKQVA